MKHLDVSKGLRVTFSTAEIKSMPVELQALYLICGRTLLFDLFTLIRNNL